MSRTALHCAAYTRARACSIGQPASYMAVEVPRRGISVPDGDITEAISRLTVKLGYLHPTGHQSSTISAFLGGKDVLVILSTGEGKSFCFLLLPLVFDEQKDKSTRCDSDEHSIAIIVSPLISLMKDQAHKYNSSNLRCAFIGKARHSRYFGWQIPHRVCKSREPSLSSTLERNAVLRYLQIQIDCLGY